MSDNLSARLKPIYRAFPIDDDRKAELSVAHPATLAAEAGHACQCGPWLDMDGIYVTIRTG